MSVLTRGQVIGHINTVNTNRISPPSCSCPPLPFVTISCRSPLVVAFVIPPRQAAVDAFFSQHSRQDLTDENSYCSMTKNGSRKMYFTLYLM